MTVEQTPHTPGPLRYFRLTEPIELPNGDAVFLYEIATEPIDDSFHTTGYAFTREDAALYAAAPLLLEVVREYCQDIQSIGIDLDDWPDLRETYEHAQAALRLAKRKDARPRYQLSPCYQLGDEGDAWGVTKETEDEPGEWNLVAVVDTETLGGNAHPGLRRRARRRVTAVRYHVL